MSVPDRPGHYWWRDDRESDWEPLYIGSGLDGTLGRYVGPMGALQPLERIGGDWGPPIPEPSVLKPWLLLACGFMVCPECGACGPDADPQPEHYDDCPWFLAQESQDAGS